MSIEQLPVELLRPSHIRVLLVPIHPIRRDTFRKYVDIISEFSVVPVTDLTKPDSTRAQSKYTQQMYEHDGYLRMNYVTFYDKEHAPLEEMQPWRQIVAVIGVMHCQQVPSIGEGFKRFQHILSRYPAVLASRCFAFEPTEQQADDTRGCIMIPDDPKKLSFYLQTQVNDLANELLIAFGNMAAHAEKRPMINGPIMSSPLALPSGSATSSPMTAIASPSALHAGSSTASLAPSPHTASGGVLSATRENSVATLASQDSTASMLGSLFAPDKTKKRTPARAQKIVGDMFLLAGRVDLAISSYLTALEAMKTSADYQWQASTMESYYCALILSLLPKTGAWPPDGNDEPAAASEDVMPSIFGRLPLSAPTYVTLFEAARSHPQFRMLICDIPDRYREISALYERAYQPGVPGHYPYLQTQACLIMAKFLAAMWNCKFNGPITNGAGVLLFVPESKGIADIASNMGLPSGRAGGAASSATGGMGPPGPAADKDRIVLHGGLGASRADVSSWAMKAWGLGIEYLTLSDQIRCVTAIATAYALVGHRKKHGFFLRQTALLLAANLKGPSRMAGRMGSLPDISETGELQPTKAPESGGLLECMHNVCEAYGASEMSAETDAAKGGPMALFDDDNDDWADEYFDESDLDNATGDDSQSASKPTHVSRVRYGWPHLQIDALKEFIDMAETVGGELSDLTFVCNAPMIRFHKYLSEAEQLDILDALHHASTSQAIAGHSGPFECCRVPVLRRVEVIRQPVTEIPYPHPRSLLSGAGASDDTKAKDPFLYNPFADKGKAQKKDLGRSVLLVTGETAYFDVTLANPFMFDLEVEDLTLHTADLEFKSIPRTSLSIPALARAFKVRLSGIPLRPGTLCIKGIRAKVFGGVQVEVSCLSRLLEDPKMRTKDGRRRPQDETMRFGKKPEGKTAAKIDSSKVVPEWSIPIKVVPAQPVLQIVKNVAAPTSRMLFAGERTAFPVRLENVGNTTIDFITVGLLESYMESEPRAALSPDGGQEEPEDVYERDVYWRNVRAMWVEKDQQDEQKTPAAPVAPVMGNVVVERLPVNLKPRERTDVMIGFTGGTITISYASTALESEPSSSEPSGSPSCEPDTTFYTRILVQPVLITVTRSLHPLTMDMMLLTDRSDFTTGEQERNLSIEEMTVDPDMAPGAAADSAREDFCLFVLDLRNFWRGVFEVVFEVFDDPDSPIPSYETRTVIHAGVTKRIHLPLKRLHLPTSVTSQRIPAPDWKQFVVGKTRKRTPEEEGEKRTWFWYREHVLARLRVRWAASGDRRGIVPLRTLKLGRDMGRVVRTAPVRVTLQLRDKHGSQMEMGRWRVGCWETVTAVWTIHNAMDRPLQPLLRILPTRSPPPSVAFPNPSTTTTTTTHLHPTTAASPSSPSPASASNILPAGPLQTVLTTIPPGQHTSYALPFIPTGPGPVCLLWCVEDVDRAAGPTLSPLAPPPPPPIPSTEGERMHVPPPPPPLRHAWDEVGWCGGEDAVVSVV
ncbi:TRAPP II complex [Powellomyces hirtus]|nr:TRAPP II complex [Powellomyces hirtus]